LFLPFYLLWKVSSGTWIGLGDGKLAIGIGFLLGTISGLSAIVFSFWIGAIFAIFIMLISRLELLSSRITMKSELPFGPFMIIATLIVFFTGISATDTIAWVSSLFI
jgi:leader peptidase (prepilin peptidase)/N-methyltransferase